MSASQRVAIVTGAGRGMGAAIARRLAADGYGVGLLSPGQTVEPLAAELNGVAVRGSVTEPADLEHLVVATLQRFGRIDAVVVNAGHPPKGPLLEIPDADWHLGLVLGLAMIVNQEVASLGGVLVPLGLSKMGLDPALASGTFVTTLTDVMGFFAFLGLATVMLI